MQEKLMQCVMVLTRLHWELDADAAGERVEI